VNKDTGIEVVEAYDFDRSVAGTTILGRAPQKPIIKAVDLSRLVWNGCFQRIRKSSHRVQLWPVALLIALNSAASGVAFDGNLDPPVDR